MSAAISSLVTPFSRARPMCDRSWSGRFSAMSALTVTRLRSRCDSAESGQTSPYNTRFVISASFGANSFIARGVTDGRALSPATPGGRATIMNFSVAEAEDMPDIAANSYSIAFGDFSRGYLIVDRLGVRVLRDPYSQKPYVLFYTTKRVGGGVQDFDAIKLIKFGTA